MTASSENRSNLVKLAIHTLHWPSGEGVTSLDQKPLWVANTLPDETVELKVYTSKSKKLQIQQSNRLTDSPSRVVPQCALATVCGGCQLQHLSYEAQLTQKQQWIQTLLQESAGITQERIEPVIPSQPEWAYRHKVQYPVQQTQQSKRFLLGFYKKNSHELINVKYCPVQVPIFDELARVLRELFVQFNYTAYQEKTGQGLLRHVVARYSQSQEKLAVLLVINSNELPQASLFSQSLLRQMPALQNLSLNHNTKAGNTILSNDFSVVYGDETIQETVSLSDTEALQFQFSVGSFFQINPFILKPLLQLILAKAQLSGEELVIDAYCGVGVLALALAKHAKQVIGFEPVASAVQDAQANARLNQIDNATFIQGSAEEQLKQMQHVDVLVLDPPRSGCTAQVIEHIHTLKPTRILYVSCNPKTLGRDLASLAALYQVESVTPLDMFPHTTHIETLSVLERRAN